MPELSCSTKTLPESSKNDIGKLSGLSRLLILTSSFSDSGSSPPAPGIIDSFVFSSPSKIVRCFWNMVLDKSIFQHLWSHSLRNHPELSAGHLL